MSKKRDLYNMTDNFSDSDDLVRITLTMLANQFLKMKSFMIQLIIMRIQKKNMTS